MRLELYKDFRFTTGDIGHDWDRSEIKNGAAESYLVRVSIGIDPNGNDSLEIDFAAIGQMLASVADRLSETGVGQINGRTVSLQDLSLWVWDQISPDLPGLGKIRITHEVSGDFCEFQETDVEGDATCGLTRKASFTS